MNANSYVLVWDLETVPDIKGFAAANGHDGKSDEEIRAAIGDKFSKHLYHSIICIGALIAHRDNDQWIVDALGAPHVGALLRWYATIAQAEIHVPFAFAETRQCSSRSL
jgi:hypothetical protein